MVGRFGQKEAQKLHPFRLFFGLFARLQSLRGVLLWLAKLLQRPKVDKPDKQQRTETKNKNGVFASAQILLNLHPQGGVIIRYIRAVGFALFLH
jgi:hypothetical protein